MTGSSRPADVRGARPRGPARPLRADAARNLRAIVAAAREAFEHVGPDVSLEEVARRAGVGPSTLYRRFAGRDELVAAVLEQYFTETVEPLLARTAREGEPWRALAEVLEGMVATVVHHRPLLRAARRHGALTPAVAARVVGPLEDLVARARAAGVVRPDLDARDLPRVVLMSAVTAGPADGEPDDRVWPRYLALLLDGLRPAPGPLPALVEKGGGSVVGRRAGADGVPPAGASP